MKIISWNCQGAFRKKAALVLAHQPDILLVQECECPDKLAVSTQIQQPIQSYWYGDNLHKGIGLFSYSDFTFELVENFNPQFRYVLPFRVKGRGQDFTLFAVWAMDNKEIREARYIGQVWLAIQHYATLLKGPAILMGDFNSNKIWDYRDRIASHSAVVSRLANNHIHSVYHRHLGQEQGKEVHPTFFLYRKKKKPYHLDYCFASGAFCDKIKQVAIGAHKNWTKHSDHMPLIVEFDL